MSIARCSVAAGLRRCLPMVLVVAAACGKDTGPAGDAPPPAPPPGVYAGTYPCDGCPGIDVALWLRDDGTFLLEQRYRAAAESAPPPSPPSHALGNWNWRADVEVLELSSGGPERVFDREGDALIQRTSSSAEHRLDRDPARVRIDASLWLRGTIRQAGDGYRFRECRTSLEAPVAAGGEYRRFHNQYRNIVLGTEASIVLIGHFDWGPDGAPVSLTIDQFVTLRDAPGC